MIDNLAAIWPNYRRYGATRAVMARAVQTQDELDGLRRAVSNSHWTVCRLTAEEGVIADRLRQRETGTARAFLLRISPGIAAAMADNAVEDFVVDNGVHRELTDVATEILNRWRDVHQRQ
jgi:hypothetical protein